MSSCDQFLSRDNSWLYTGEDGNPHLCSKMAWRWMCMSSLIFLQPSIDFWSMTFDVFPVDAVAGSGLVFRHLMCFQSSSCLLCRAVEREEKLSRDSLTYCMSQWAGYIQVKGNIWLSLSRLPCKLHNTTHLVPGLSVITKNKMKMCLITSINIAKN